MTCTQLVVKLIKFFVYLEKIQINNKFITTYQPNEYEEEFGSQIGIVIKHDAYREKLTKFIIKSQDASQMSDNENTPVMSTDLITGTASLTFA